MQLIIHYSSPDPVHSVQVYPGISYLFARAILDVFLNRAVFVVYRLIQANSEALI